MEQCGQCDIKPSRPSFLRLIGFFVLAYLAGQLLSRLGWFGEAMAFNESTTLASVFFIGLVAASSSCIAVSGGIMLSSIAQRGQTKSTVAQFVLGRVLSYGVFGALIGLIGASFQLSATAMGVITVLAALYMLVVGLEMLGLAPSFLRKLAPKLPAILKLDAGRTPLLLGAATFLLPCGFTQALQLYALTTGSPLRSGLLLFMFALGTAPSLVLLGFAAQAMKGKASEFFFRFAGAAVVLIGAWTLQNGLTAAGVVLPTLVWVPNEAQAAVDPNVYFDGKEQVIRVRLGYDPVYVPADSFTVKAGIPVRMEILGVGTGCRNIFQIPKFNVRTALNQEVNVIRFTPTEVGRAVFSCSMGMFPGTINVINS